MKSDWLTRSSHAGLPERSAAAPHDRLRRIPPETIDEYNLHRFCEAQDPVYDEALAILRNGAMCTAYMDFIFPRLRAEQASQALAIASLDEARAYLIFPVLGDRYRECIQALFWLDRAKATDVFAAHDARKLHASLTLFSEASGELMLRTMLAIWFDNALDQDTISRIDLRP